MRSWDDQAKDDKLNLSANEVIIRGYLDKYKSILKKLIPENLN